MQVTVRWCAGPDVHQATVVACVLIHGRHKKLSKAVRKFGTMTCELEALRDWLKQEGVTHVGMESPETSMRKPVYEVLEDQFKLIVGNARHTRNVPCAIASNISAAARTSWSDGICAAASPMSRPDRPRG